MDAMFDEHGGDEQMNMAQDDDLPGLVNIQKAMENHHAIHGKIHYFDWAIFNCFL